MKTNTLPSAHIIWLMALILTIQFPTIVRGMEQTPEDERFNSMEISLLTCSPHDEIYSLYGHTAIRCQDSISGQDVVVNYGVFDFNQPYFILRFVFGLTDYCMGIVTIDQFINEYSYYKCGVTQQVINLTNSEKATIMRALTLNSLPENSTYRYNYFHDNCTTRARDMITSHLNGSVEYDNGASGITSFRKIVHSCTADYPWNRFGIDLLLGVNADMPINKSQQQFLPANLEHDFSTATITSGDGNRPLVKQTISLLDKGEQESSGSFPLSPIACFLIFLIITIFVIIMEQRTLKMLWGYDLAVMLVCGLAGIILTLMIFSHHPTVSLNLQILLLNPLHLFFLIPLCRRSHKGEEHFWWKVGIVLCILFILGRFFQTYAEGMMILALSLLIRIISHEILVMRKAKAIHKATVSTK